MLGGVTVQTQRNYESGRRAPDSRYLNRLSAAGVDVRFVIASPDAPQPVILDPDEIRLVDDYRSLTDEMRAKVLGYLQAAVDLDLRRGTSRTIRRPAPPPKKKPAKKK